MNGDQTDQRQPAAKRAKAEVFPLGDELDLSGISTRPLDDWLKNQMLDAENVTPPDGTLLDPEEMEYNLQNRDEAMSTGKVLLNNLFRSASRNNRSRLSYTMPVCAAIPGIGKSRLLQEWAEIFREGRFKCDDGFPPVEQRMSVIITYGNGHSPQPEEKSMGAVAGFAWRLLYAVFLRGNAKFTWDVFWSNLPSNAGRLKLGHALDVIRLVFGPNANGAGAKTDFALFVGIDEFQRIPNNYSEPPEPEPLSPLLDALTSAMSDPKSALMIFPMFAGTDWEKISIAASKSSSENENFASACTERLPMPLLDQQAMRDAIMGKGQVAEKLLEEQLFCKHLFYLGGVPRPCTKYTEECILFATSQDSFPAGSTKKAYKKAFKKIFENFVQGVYMNAPSDDQAKRRKRTGFTLKELISLVSYSVQGKPVRDNVKPFRLLTNSSNSNQHLKFRRLRDGSVCLLDDNRVFLPYCFFHYLSWQDLWEDEYNNLSEAEKAFMDTLAYLGRYVDRNVFDPSNAPWQQWEIFGACFTALRINAILITSENPNHKLSRVFYGASTNLIDHEVILHPMRVVKAREKFSGTTPESIHMEDEGREMNWVEKGLVVLNGENGKGIDIFYTLELAGNSDKKKYVLVTDQRKRVHGCIDVKETIKKASITPGKFQKEAGVEHVVVALFSMFTLNDSLPPKHSVAVTNGEHEKYHGALYQHPAAAAWVQVNVEGVTALRGLFKTNGQDCAKRIIAAREGGTKFKSFSDLQQFLGNASFFDEAESNCDFTI